MVSRQFLLDNGCFEWTFRDDIVEQVRCEAEDWQEHGPAIVTHWQVERVILWEIEPWESKLLLGMWCLDDVPNFIYDYLQGQRFEQEVSEGIYKSRTRYYPSREAAIADSSSACIHWAKGE